MHLVVQCLYSAEKEVASFELGGEYNFLEWFNIFLLFPILSALDPWCL